MDGLEVVMAGRLRALLDEHGWRHEDLARAMTGLGFRWTANRVTQVVTGRRPLSLLEVAGVCCLLRIPLADFLGADGDVELPGVTVDLADVTQALQGGWIWAEKRATHDRLRGAYAEHMEATVKAARRLGVTPTEVDQAARALWGRVLADERDRRVSAVDGETPRAIQARRGHVTRALLEELREHLTQARKAQA